jgi:hypothetical protein
MSKKHKIMEATIEATKKLDVFPKIQEDYTEASSARGTISIIVFLTIFLLVCLEIKLFFKYRLEYKYEVIL